MTQTNRPIRKSTEPSSGARRTTSGKSDYDLFSGNGEHKSTRQSSASRSSGTNAKKTSSKVQYQGDLAAAWGELDRESKREEELRQARARRQAAQRPQTVNRSTTNRTPTRKPSAYSNSRTPQARRTASSGRSSQYPVRPHRDAFDESFNRPKHPPRRRKKRRGAGLTLLLLACIVTVGILAGVQYNRYQTFLTMKAAVEHQGFYSGTTVEGIDVSGMSLEDAIAYWQENIENQYTQRSVTLSNGASFTAGELGYSSDYQSMLSAAWSAGRSGSLEARYAAINDRLSQPVSYSVTRKMYDESVIAQCVAAIAEQIDRPAEDAKIESFDVSTYSFTFTDEVIGSQLDQDTLAANMIQTLEAGGGTVELPVSAIQPSVLKADISSQYGLIAYAVTNASSSKSNRLSNISLALQMINGTCLEPGETFSFNDVVGERTTARGFKSATAYSSGKVVEEVGGGICQVSTTLFNAVVKADLEIVERHNHSLTVSYVDKGKDAAVNWGGQDLRFKNNSSDNVYICCYMTDDKRVRVGVFGKLLENGETITVEAETTGTIDYETVYQANTSLATGTTQVLQSGKNGYTAVAYKVRWDANGNKISSELLCKSTYRATDEIIEYGP